jgi:hypothetical protein
MGAIHAAVSGLTIMDEATRSYYEVVQTLTDGCEGAAPASATSDNEFAGERFQAVVEIFGTCGFLVHHPYIGDRPIPSTWWSGGSATTSSGGGAPRLHREGRQRELPDRIRKLARQADPPLTGVFRCDAPAPGLPTYEL